ncbi:alpha/beta fold hydrolase [Halovenus sp. WSH3]|uniref:Alpha/beta fold hydrolase n=1 Tax=Halovenus carboxidivorans TaxID=2692199 RepID=A0A6B0T0J3_9EURY|nr:alpha/beta fold hydrolase [Halovenus carboxidivorans]
MYTTTEDGVDLYSETAGEGETVAFVGDCGFGAWQWAWQYDALAGPYETLAWDLRGTGRSDSPAGPYDVDRLAADFEAVLADNSARRVHVVGAGLGGMIALRYAREYGRAASLALFGTAPRGAAVDLDALRALYPDPDDRERSGAVRDSLSGAFSPAFRESDAFEQVVDWRREEDALGDGLAAQIAAVEGFETGPLYELTVPTLVFHGLADPVVDSAVGRELAADLPRGEFVPVEGRRLAHVEHARAVTDRLDGFVDDHRSG